MRYWKKETEMNLTPMDVNWLRRIHIEAEPTQELYDRMAEDNLRLLEENRMLKRGAWQLRAAAYLAGGTALGFALLYTMILLGEVLK